MNANLHDIQKVLFLKYEDLKVDAISQVKKLADTEGINGSKEEWPLKIASKFVIVCNSFKVLFKLQFSFPTNFLMMVIICDTSGIPIQVSYCNNLNLLFCAVLVQRNKKVNETLEFNLYYNNLGKLT